MPIKTLIVCDSWKSNAKRSRRVINRLAALRGPGESYGGLAMADGRRIVRLLCLLMLLGLIGVGGCSASRRGDMRSQSRAVVDIDVGIGKLFGRPSAIVLAQRPAAPSTPPG
jgi:hypothetical protein